MPNGSRLRVRRIGLSGGDRAPRDPQIFCAQRDALRGCAPSFPSSRALTSPRSHHSPPSLRARPAPSTPRAWCPIAPLPRPPRRPVLWRCAADVHFILDHCDTDGSGSIDRVELLPMLAEWKARRRRALALSPGLPRTGPDACESAAHSDPAHAPPPPCLTRR